MKLKMISVFFMLVLFGLQWDPGALGHPPPPEKRKPRIRLTDGFGRKLKLPGQPSFAIEEIGISDSLFGSFFFLEPNKRYSIHVMRSDGKEISHLHLTSDKLGIIPTCALWWDMGLTYGKDEGKKGAGPDFHKYNYNCMIKQENELIHEVPIPVSKPTANTYIYTCDKDGHPKNRFRLYKDDVYLAARNLGHTNDKMLYIYVLKDRWTWRDGDKLDDKEFFKGKIITRLKEKQAEFTQSIWQRDNLEAGSYDVVVSRKRFGILFKNDLIDDGYGVGFKVIDPNAKSAEKGKGGRDVELACQAPSRFKIMGALVNPHDPIYKDYFSPIENIWVAMESGKHDVEAGKARIYVIKHSKNKDLQDGDPLLDVSGGYEEVLLQPGCAQAMYTQVWDRPKTREKGYDVVIDFKNSSGKYGTYEEGLDILDSGEKGGFYVPAIWVCLDSVSFNHTGNSIGGDALTIKLNRDKAVRVPEWQRGEKAFYVAYVKDSRVAVRPGFIASKGIYNATLKAYAGSGNLGDIKAAQIYINNQKSSPNSYFQVVKNTPHKIQSFYQEWEWYLLGINGDANKKEIHIGTSINKMYIVLGVPQHPWTIEGKIAPWTDILDLSCQVAYGESTPEAAARKITQFLYGEVGAKYVKTANYSKENDAFSDFQLTRFQKNIPNVGSVNCYDMGKALVTFANVLGCNLTPRYCNTFGDLNCIKSTGNDWDCKMSFNNHAFASIGDNVFDASLKVNSWDNPGRKPYRAAWMINIPWPDYREMVVKTAKAQHYYPQIAIFKIEK